MSFKAIFDAKKLSTVLESLNNFRDKKGIIPSMECFAIESVPDGNVFMLGARSFVQLREALPIEKIALLQAMHEQYFYDRDQFIARIERHIGSDFTQAVIDACEKIVRISATDSYIGGFRYISAVVVEHGSFLVNYKILDLVREMGSLDIRVEEQPDTYFAHIFYKKTVYKVPGMASKDFHSNIHMPMPECKLCDLDGLEFFTTLKTLAPYKCTSEVRLALQGINIRNLTENTVNLTTLEYNRLITYTTPTQYVSERADVTLSNELVNAMRCESASGSVSVYKDESFAFVQHNDATFFSRILQDITFADYKGMALDRFSEQNAYAVRVQIQDCVAVLKRIKTLCADTFSAKLSLEHAVLTVSTLTSTFGEGEETLDVTANNDDTCVTAVNAQMLIEQLNLFGQSREAILYLPKDKNFPIFIKSDQEPNIVQFLQVLNV